MSRTPPLVLCPDTASRSLVHWLVRYRRDEARSGKLVLTYLIAATIAYLPLFVAALLSTGRLWDQQGSQPLPFLRDFGLAGGLLISFPSLLLLFVTDERRL